MVKMHLRNKKDDFTDYELGYFEKYMSESFYVDKRKKLVSGTQILNYSKSKLQNHIGIEMAQKWYFLGVLSIFYVYFYIFMEWLFFVTKPSFFSAIGAYEEILILVITPLPPVLMSLLAIFVLWVASRITENYINQEIFTAIARVIPALILTATILILTDNFTYTLFKFGIKSLDSLWRLGYGALFLLLFVYVYKKLYSTERRKFLQARFNMFLYGAVALLAISSGGIVLAYFSIDAVASGNTYVTSNIKKLPNILLIASDGLNADHMSVYGYNRDTTPFIRKFARNALVFENCMPNSSNSGGSIASMLTGKLPTQTRVIYPPDILKGKDAYQHLPAILRKQGYRSIDLSIRHYADAYDLNMRNSFDSANFRKAQDFKLRYLSNYLGSSIFDPEIYFFEQIYERIESRLLHISGIRKMIDPFGEVVNAKKKKANFDIFKVLVLERFMEESDTPVFAHLHLLGTHSNGGRFLPNRRVFSIGKKQDAPFMIDFYDDAILDFDRYVEDIIKYLKTSNKLKDTIVVIHSDHGMRWKTNVRIPLIIYFPDQSHVGRVSINTQHIDIAPTILDYLGIEIPEWMEGKSLLVPGIDRLRPIISVSVSGIKVMETGWQEKTNPSPPFYGLGFVSVDICHKSYRLNLKNNVFSVSEIIGHTAPCDNSEMPDNAQVKYYIVNHLRENGYDVSSIVAP